MCSDAGVDPFHVRIRPSERRDVFPEKGNNLVFRVIGKVSTDSDSFGLVIVVDGYLKNLFFKRIDLLDWFGDCVNVGSRLLFFYLSDEEISSSCLVASNSDDPSVVSREFNTLVIGGRDSLHHMDPWRT